MPVQRYKAETLMSDKQSRLAAAQFEQIVRQHPDNVVPLNNLALAYQLSQDARAAQAAEAAYQLASDQPVVMDTLGWILVEQGDTARGLPVLQKASALAPKARHPLSLGDGLVQVGRSGGRAQGTANASGQTRALLDRLQ